MAFLRLTTPPFSAVILHRSITQRDRMTQINAYINFNGNCRQALSFYHECIGGELDLQTVAGSPVEGECVGLSNDQILHGSLTKGAIVLMGSDMIGPEGYTKGNNIALALACSSPEEIERYYRKLSADGEQTYPLHKEFWGATFGILNDKFGIRWMLTYDENLQRN
jgi:PhnB protein